MFDERTGAALNAIGTGLVHRFAGRDITFDVARVERRKAHAGYRQHVFEPAPVADRDRGQHAVTAAGQQPEHACGVGCVGRLAQYFAVDLDRGVGRQHQAGRQTPPGQSLFAAQGLGARHAHDVAFGVFAVAHIFQHVDVLARQAAEGQYEEGCADLGQQFTPARAARCQVERGRYGGRKTHSVAQVDVAPPAGPPRGRAPPGGGSDIVGVGRFILCDRDGWIRGWLHDTTLRRAAGGPVRAAG